MGVLIDRTDLKETDSALVGFLRLLSDLSKQDGMMDQEFIEFIGQMKVSQQFDNSLELFQIPGIKHQARQNTDGAL